MFYERMLLVVALFGDGCLSYFFGMVSFLSDFTHRGAWQ